MSYVRLCDRCGEKLERDVPKVRLRTFRYILDIETSCERQEYDLCEWCMEDLTEFLNECREDENGQKH